MSITPEVQPLLADMKAATTRVAKFVADEVAAAVAPIQSRLDEANATIATMKASHADDVAALTAGLSALSLALTPSKDQVEPLAIPPAPVNGVPKDAPPIVAPVDHSPADPSPANWKPFDRPDAKPSAAGFDLVKGLATPLRLRER